MPGGQPLAPRSIGTQLRQVEWGGGAKKRHVSKRWPFDLEIPQIRCKAWHRILGLAVYYGIRLLWIHSIIQPISFFSASFVHTTIIINQARESFWV